MEIKVANFKKLAKEAKKFQQYYTGVMESSEGSFKYTYRMLNGLDGMWVFRGNFAGESSTSQNLTIDHRSACASLISLEDEDEVMTPVDIIKILFLEEELENVDSLLEKFDDNEVEKLSYKVLWNSVKGIKTVEDFLALGPANRELVWDLLHLGLQRTFDTDFNLSFGYTWAQAYKKVKPNIANLALQAQLDKIKASLQVSQDPSQEIQPVEETNGNPSEATGS
jgi:hypothetical protein